MRSGRARSWSATSRAKGDLSGTHFSVEQELADSERGAARIRELADDAQVLARLRQQARDRLREENRDPDDEGALRLAVARARKEWIRAELTRQGIERAAEWGWPNIYTYTKSMGDQLVARETGIFRSIVRPAIVESAVEFPFRGWNEGFTTSAPLVYLALKGQNVLPVNDKLILDVVPVDHVAAGMLMVAAQACVEQPELVHQLSSGDLNPLRINRVVTLTGLYKRKRFQDKETGNRFVNELAARMEFRPVSQEEYDAWSLPLVNRVAQKAATALARIRPRWGGGRFTEVIDRLKKNVDEVSRVTDEAQKNIELFRPFIFDNQYVFRADHIRALRDRFTADDQNRLRWGPEALDWYDYWMNIHFPGLQRWVLPELDETYAARPKQIYSYHDLLELFDTTTKLHATRVAAAHRARQARGDLHLRRPAGAGEPRGRLPDRRVGDGGRPRDPVRQERARVGHGVLRHHQGGRDRGADRLRVDGGRARQHRARVVGDRHPHRRQPLGKAQHAHARAQRGRAGHQGVAVPQGVRAAGPRRRAGAREVAAPEAQPRLGGVAALHVGHDRQAQGGDADATATSPSWCPSCPRCSSSASTTACCRCCRCTTPSSSRPACWCRWLTARRSPT